MTSTSTSSTVEGKKKMEKKNKKHDKKDKKARKTKERSDIEKCREVHDPEDPRDTKDEEATSPRTKRRKVTTSSTTIAAHDDVADSKTSQGTGNGGGADIRKQEIPASDTNSADERSSLSLTNNEGKSRDAIRKAKREHRKMLAARLPARDENGIAYTKLQLRRMRKRLERGLEPIETPREAADRARREAEMRREEQAEWAGLLYQGKDDRNEERGDGDDDADDDGEEAHGGDENESESAASAAMKSASAVTPHATQGAATKRRTKPIPPDYVCQACQNRHQPPHWIYDCVEKVTMRGTNQVSHKFGKGAQNPKNKVFVSGLPFDATATSVTKWFTDRCGAVVSVKVLTFDDSKRCRGQAFVAFETPDSVRAALALTGTAMTTDGTAKKGKEGSSSSGKELKLKVTKALNRAVTKSKTPGAKSES